MSSTVRRRPRAPGGPFDRFAGGMAHVSLQPGRGALLLAGAMALCTAAHTWVVELRPWLAIDSAAIGELRLTGLLTNGLVARPASFIGALFLIAIAGLLFADRLRRLWHHDRGRLIVGVTLGLLALYAMQRFVLPGRAYGLLVAGSWIVWVGTAVERRWGTRRMLIFAGVIMLATNLLGALVSWVWPGSVAALVGDGLLPLFGEGPLTHGLMAVWCLMAGSRRMALLGVEARKLVWVLVAFDALDLIFGGFGAGLMGLFAIFLTWLLVTGNHRPGVAIDRVRLWWIERRIERRRQGIRVVGGREHLHRESPASAG